jgi:hypothetical protein
VFSSGRRRYCPEHNNQPLLQKVCSLNFIFLLCLSHTGETHHFLLIRR